MHHTFQQRHSTGGTDATTVHNSYIKEEKQCGNARTAVSFCSTMEERTIVFTYTILCMDQHALHVQIKIIKYELFYTYMYIIPTKLFVISLNSLPTKRCQKKKYKEKKKKVKILRRDSNPRSLALRLNALPTGPIQYFSILEYYKSFITNLSRKF